MIVALVLHYSASRRVTEIGLLVGAIGGVTVLIGGGLPLIRCLAVPLVVCYSQLASCSS